MPITRVELVSLCNRWLDLAAVAVRPDWWSFHRAVHQTLKRAHIGWADADYGAGYLYQSFRQRGLRGFRSTEARVAQMDLRDALAYRRVLEIGCNSGFLSLELAMGARYYAAFDNNPYLIELARLAQAEVRDSSVDFRVESFESFACQQPFDVVLSFANHSTWDGNMTLDLQTYFAKLQSLLVANGRLFFESHHPALEREDKLEATLEVLRQYFCIESRRVLMGGSAWDRGRTFVVARSLRQS